MRPIKTHLKSRRLSLLKSHLPDRTIRPIKTHLKSRRLSQLKSHLPGRTIRPIKTHLRDRRMRPWTTYLPDRKIRPILTHLTNRIRPIMTSKIILNNFLLKSATQKTKTQFLDLRNLPKTKKIIIIKVVFNDFQ